MAKFTVIGDPHAKPNNLDRITQLFDMIEKLGNPCIILGDLLDTKELIRGKCLNHYFRRLSQSNLEFIILVGNHDWFNLECQDHSLETLAVLPNVTIVDTPMTLHGCHFWPYMPEHVPAGFDKLERLPVFCHIDSPGFDYGNGHVSDHGADYQTLRHFPRVISGHYHKYQEKEFFTYLGTPFSHSFGESNQTKYIGIFDTETHELELIETDFPKHLTLEINVDEVAPDALDLQLTLPDINQVRVVLSGSQKAMDAWSLAEHPNIKWLTKPTREISKAVIDETFTPEKQFLVWAKEVANLDPSVVELGLEVLLNVSKN